MERVKDWNAFNGDIYILSLFQGLRSCGRGASKIVSTDIVDAYNGTPLVGHDIAVAHVKSP